MNKELLEKIDKKLKEIKLLRNLSSKDFRFKTWHASTINLLKMLPSDFINNINDFKKLTFTDTKYHRGTRPFNPLDNTRYVEDLDHALNILKKITSVKRESKPVKVSTASKENKTEKDTSPQKELPVKSKGNKISAGKKTGPSKKSKLVPKQKTTEKTKTKETTIAKTKGKNSSSKK